MNPALEITNLVVPRGDRTVLDVEHLSLDDGELLAIIGPNGAGKSTLLLVMARLLKADGGQISFYGQPFETLDELSYRRQIGLVLQDPLLLDRSVFDNAATGLRFRRLPRAQVSRQAEMWLERLGVLHLRERQARQLSGGEAQRVSLARAFALQPKLLLLDEPFGALDAPTRARLLDDLHDLLGDNPVTTVFVTHDQDEAMLLGDRVAVILDGRLRQVGTPQQVFGAPADSEVAAFVGVETVIAGEVTAASEGRLIVRANGLLLEAVGELSPGRQVLFCLRPEDVTLWPAGAAPVSSARNRLAGRILRSAPHGALVRVVVDCGFSLSALVTRASAEELNLNEGQPVTAAFKASAVHLIPR
jgi:tungstate transport system ATP-binding protein